MTKYTTYDGDSPTPEPTTSLYTPEIRRFVRTRPWPRGLIMDVVEYPDYLGFRFYRDNFIQFDGEAQRQIASTVKEVMEKLRGLGIPCYMEKMERVSDGGSDLAQ